METRHPVEDHLAVNFRRSVIIAELYRVIDHRRNLEQSVAIRRHRNLPIWAKSDTQSVGLLSLAYTKIYRDRRIRKNLLSVSYISIIIHVGNGARAFLFSLKRESDKLLPTPMIHNHTNMTILKFLIFEGSCTHILWQI